MTTAPEKLSSRAQRLWPIPVAIAAGIAGAVIGGLEGPWIGFIFAAVIFAAIFVAAADHERLAVLAFVFSLQAHANYRLFYGQAGSDGIAFPVSVCAGLVVLVVWGLTGRLKDTRLGGSLGGPIAGLLGMTFLSLLFTQERFVGVANAFTAVQLYFVYWLALNLVRDDSDIERVLRLLFVALAIQSLVYFVQSALGTGFNLEGDIIEQGAIPRPGGTVSTNPAGFASFVMPILFVVIARWLAGARPAGRYAFLAIIGSIAIGLTFTRVAWAGYAFGCVLMLVLGARRGLIAPRRITLLPVLAVGAVLAFGPTMMARLAREPISASYDERAGLMNIALDVIASNPITGIGPGAYEHRFKAWVPEGPSHQWLYTVHNEFLLRAAETGIIGGALFIILLIGGLRLAWRLTAVSDRYIATMALGWCAGILALAWQMYWVPWTGFEYNALLWLMLGLCDAALRLHPEASAQFTRSTLWRTGAGKRGAVPPRSSSRAPTSGALPLQGM